MFIGGYPTAAGRQRAPGATSLWDEPNPNEGSCLLHYVLRGKLSVCIEKLRGFGSGNANSREKHDELEWCSKEMEGLRRGDQDTRWARTLRGARHVLPLRISGDSHSHFFVGENPC